VGSGKFFHLCDVESVTPVVHVEILLISIFDLSLAEKPLALELELTLVAYVLTAVNISPHFSVVEKVNKICWKTSGACLLPVRRRWVDRNRVNIYPATRLGKY
jgi:hypothetical protein